MDKAKLWTNEGQPNNIQPFFSKSRLILNPHSRLPPWGSCRLLPTEEIFASLPLLPEENSANFISSAKIVSLFPKLPLGGSSLQSKGMRGSRTTFRYFFQKAALYATRVLGVPFGEAVGFRRLKRSLQAFPSGVRWTKQSFGRMRGSRTTFRHFLFKKPLYNQPAFPASPSGKLSASAD